MNSLSPDLLKRLRTTLSSWGPFDSTRGLKAVFIDERIYPWRDAIPETERKRDRINAIIADLSVRYNNEYENALVLFLRVIAEGASPEDACHHEFLKLANQLESLLIPPERKVHISHQEIQASRTTAAPSNSAIEHSQNRPKVIGWKPAAAKHFLGREEELRDLREKLAMHYTRIVVITGRAGMGKTALAARLLEELEEKLKRAEGLDGIACFSAQGGDLTLDYLYYELRRFTNDEARETLDALWQDKLTSLQRKARSLLEYLCHDRYVLLIDNMEDALDSRGSLVDQGLEAFFAACLESKDAPHIICTSRQPLRFRHRNMYVREVHLDSGLDTESASSFLRTLDIDNHARLQEASQATLNSFAERTYGIPRALEYVYNLLSKDITLTPEALLARKDLWHTEVIDKLQEEAFEGLSSYQQYALQFLALFNRPVPLAALTHVIREDIPDLQEMLSDLVRRTFIQYDTATCEYMLHPLDTETWPRHLTQEERKTMHLRIADYYKSRQPPQEQWLSLEDMEWHLEQFDHLCYAGYYDEAAQLLNSIHDNYLYRWGHYGLLQNLRQRLQGHLKDRKLHAKNLFGLGSVKYSMGHPKEATEYFKEAIAHTPQNDLQDLGRYKGLLALSYYASWQGKRARDLYKEALQIAEQAGDVEWQIQLLGHLGNVSRHAGNFEESSSLYQQALDMAREHEIRQLEGIQLGRLGTVFHNVGNYLQALNSYQEALEIACETGVRDRRREGIWLGRIAQLYWTLRYYKLSAYYYEQSLKIASKIGHNFSVGTNLLGLGRIAITLEQHKLARQHLSKVLDLDILATNYRATCIQGIAGLKIGKSTARPFFKKSIGYCEDLLNSNSASYLPHYTLATAHVGYAICDSKWDEETNRPNLLRLARDVYEKAKNITLAFGIVADALHDLELMRNAGIEGLEPIFELLQNSPPSLEKRDHKYYI